MNSTKQLQETINGHYGGFDSLEDFVRKAHAVDYDGTRAMFEAFRVRVPKGTGIVQWMLNSAWPSLYWQQYDWYGVPTAGYYGTKKACEPVQLLFDYATRKVYAVNETPAARELKATVKVFDAASKLIGTESKTVKVGYRDVLPVFDLKRYDGKPHFVALALTDGNTPVADNFYVLPAKDNEYNWSKTNWYITPITSYADLGFAFRQAPAEVEMSVEGNQITLTNKSDVIAYMNILKAKDTEGNLVTPAYWSDNFFPLLPGETKVVTCKTDVKDVQFELVR
jgi:exo-1,4-beta-D-glucosaminidase